METAADNMVIEPLLFGNRVTDRQLAGFAPRLLSLLVDIIVIRLSIFLLLSPLNNLFQGLSAVNMGENPGRVGSFLLYIALRAFLPFFISLFYFVAFWSISGETIGKKVFGLRVVGDNGQPLSFKNAMLRYLGYFISAVFFAGFIWAAFDEKKQGWHDRLATSHVVVV